MKVQFTVDITSMNLVTNRDWFQFFNISTDEIINKKSIFWKYYVVMLAEFLKYIGRYFSSKPK